VYDQDWKTTQELLYYFVDILSKGGNYLINIGPDGKGHVPEASAKSLIEMGDWIAKNKEVVYGTSQWKVANEGQSETLIDGTGHRASKGLKRSFTTSDFWFTAKENKVYAISLVPSSTTIFIKSLNKKNGNYRRVSILGDNQKLEWKQTNEGLVVTLATPIKNKNGFTIKFEK
jgi:alpha-L-fucosidase